MRLEIRFWESDDGFHYRKQAYYWHWQNQNNRVFPWEIWPNQGPGFKWPARAVSWFGSHFEPRLCCYWEWILQYLEIPPACCLNCITKKWRFFLMLIIERGDLFIYTFIYTFPYWFMFCLLSSSLLKGYVRAEEMTQRIKRLLLKYEHRCSEPQSPS